MDSFQNEGEYYIQNTAMGYLPFYDGGEYCPFSCISEDGKYSSRNGYRSANIGFTGNSAAFGMEDAF